MPTTVELVRVHLGLSPARPVDDLALDQAVAAANDAVYALRTDLDPPNLTPAQWPARCDYAATLQAARLYGRRGSVQGVAAFQDVGVAMLGRLDPDVRSLLELGEFQKSVAV
jgi:hypothetical protein